MTKTVPVMRYFVIKRNFFCSVYVQQIGQDKVPTEATSTFNIYHANKAHRQHACTTSIQSTSKQVSAVHPLVHTYR
jgi:hypothetical protein